MSVASITGHRPNRIPNKEYVEYQLTLAYKDLKIERVIQGMAAGVDLWSARMAYYSRIPYVAVRPWAGHTPSWEDKAMYNYAIEHADEIIIVNESEKFLGNWMYQRRNEWMVDHGDVVIAVWDGEPKGGTWNCIKYALDQDRKVWVIPPDPKENKNVGWLEVVS